jgi:hypothetical protein
VSIVAGERARESAPWTADEFVERLRAQGAPDQNVASTAGTALDPVPK